MNEAQGIRHVDQVSEDVVLEVNDVAVRYGVIEVLEGVSLRVIKEEVVALLGPNGAGKSSLMYGIFGTLPLTKGRILFQGKVINALPPEKRASLGMGFVFESRLLFTGMTVLDNLKLGTYNYNRNDRKETARYMEEVFQLFPILKKREKQLAGLLSGGEQQMLAVGRVLLLRPKLLLLDEPSLGLAPLMVRDLMGTLNKLKEKGITILLAEQNVEASLSIADRGYVMGTSGRVVMEGSRSELLASDMIKMVYLGTQRND
jgi:branched-chain amino acid transport system ATP-binding protein